MDYEEPDLDFISHKKLGISEPRWIAIMEMLAKERYVDGISIKRSADGEVVVSVSDLRITLKGLEYLSENSLMRKASNLAKGIAEYIP